MGPGTLIGDRYELDILIGRGGMGRVFRARDVSADAHVAVKVLHREEDEEPGRADRFKREIAILAQIQHPAVPRVLSWGEHAGELYFVAELVDGVPLRAETEKRGTWAATEAAALAAKVADALAAAHALGIVHRDVNANNIMIERSGNVRLLDFGIARSVGVDLTRLTTTGTIMGTPGYMSPEQFDARAIDERSDIYSLGVVLFEMLAGRLPFTAQTPVAVALQHKTEAPPPIRSIRSDVPAWLERVVQRCLEKTPLRRYASAGVLARELTHRRESAPRRRRMPSGDHVVEDFGERSDWVLVVSAPRQKSGWAPGLALRFEDRYYRLLQIDTPAKRDERWTYRFVAWPESDVFRGLVDYDQDCAARAAADASTFRSRFARWMSGENR